MPRAGHALPALELNACFAWCEASGSGVCADDAASSRQPALLEAVCNAVDGA